MPHTGGLITKACFNIQSKDSNEAFKVFNESSIKRITQQNAMPIWLNAVPENVSAGYKLI